MKNAPGGRRCVRGIVGSAASAGFMAAFRPWRMLPAHTAAPAPRPSGSGRGRAPRVRRPEKAHEARVSRPTGRVRHAREGGGKPDGRGTFAPWPRGGGRKPARDHPPGDPVPFERDKVSGAGEWAEVIGRAGREAVAAVDPAPHPRAPGAPPPDGTGRCSATDAGGCRRRRTGTGADGCARPPSSPNRRGPDRERLWPSKPAAGRGRTPPRPARSGRGGINAATRADRP